MSRAIAMHVPGEPRRLEGIARVVAPPAPRAARAETPLLPRIAAGDRAAARACVERYGALVWSLARRGSSSPSDAEDAVQEIFLDLWKCAARFDERAASETTFVAMIARRRLIDRRRHRARQPGLDSLDDAGAFEPSVAASAETSAEAAQAVRALDALRPDQRRVLLLSARDGLSHGEIAQSLGMPLGTVKAHARRALLAVRAALFGDRDRGEARKDPS